MMSPDNLIAKPPTNKDENHQSSGGSRKTGRPADVQALRCPRCDSPNTKFCYYNNYSLTQPRHFCKSCRRYWTKGGALRNIPIGGGCRKNKKISKSSSRLSGNSKDSADSSSYSDIGGGFKFFSGLSPAVDFQLGGLNNFPRIFQSSNNYTTGASSSSYNPHHQLNISSFGDLSTSSSCFGIDPSGNSTGNMMGFNYTVPSSSVLKQNHGSLLEDENVLHNNSNNLTSSIESLSSINQDLHWKLQQQRLAMLFGEDNHHKEAVISPVINSHHLENQTPQKPQPILFQNLEFSSKTDDSHHGVGNLRKDNNGNGIGNLATEWFFDNSNVYNPTPTNSNSTSNGLQGWSNYNQFTALP